MKLKRKLIPAVAMAVLAFSVTSCGSAYTWVRGVNINYVLLIGQTDHNDSAARTAGIRDALGTRASTTTANANTEDVQVGTLTVGSSTLTVTEVESGEQANTSGVTWDAATATNSVATWLANHADDTWTDEDGSNAATGQGINLVVSNNDGMAMAAIEANGWEEGTPVFGYDANQDVLEVIAENGDIKGTVSQNAPTQVASILMLTRNLIDGVENPYESGFGESNANDYGYVTQTVTYNSTSKALLADNVAVDSPEAAEDWLGTTSQLVSRFEGNLTQKADVTTSKIFLNSYSATDTFLTSSVEPLFEQMLSTFNLETTSSSGAYTIAGDGSDDATILDNMTDDNYAAYVINTITTTSAIEYLNKIATLEGYTEGGDRISTPVIFWNRQPTLADGSVDTDVMADSRFESIYYVGFDAEQGGQIQGEMIVNYIEENLESFWKY